MTISSPRLPRALAVLLPAGSPPGVRGHPSAHLSLLPLRGPLPLRRRHRRRRQQPGDGREDARRRARLCTRARDREEAGEEAVATEGVFVSRGMRRHREGRRQRNGSPRSLRLVHSHHRGLLEPCARGRIEVKGEERTRSILAWRPNRMIILGCVDVNINVALKFDQSTYTTS